MAFLLLILLQQCRPNPACSCGATLQYWVMVKTKIRVLPFIFGRAWEPATQLFLSLLIVSPSIWRNIGVCTKKNVYDLWVLRSSVDFTFSEANLMAMSSLADFLGWTTCPSLGVMGSKNSYPSHPDAWVGKMFISWVVDGRRPCSRSSPIHSVGWRTWPWAQYIFQNEISKVQSLCFGWRPINKMKVPT